MHFLFSIATQKVLCKKFSHTPTFPGLDFDHPHGDGHGDHGHGRFW